MRRGLLRVGMVAEAVGVEPVSKAGIRVKYREKSQKHSIPAFEIQKSIGFIRVFLNLRHPKHQGRISAEQGQPCKITGRHACIW
jgi:hypothetical protein